jgi:hypothetical protein
VAKINATLLGGGLEGEEIKIVKSPPLSLCPTPRGVAGIMVAGTPAAGIPATFSVRQGLLCVLVSQAKRVVKSSSVLQLWVIES